MTERQRAVAYYAIAVSCLAFGLLGIASIGFPFLFAGVVLLSVGPVRWRRDVVWPPLVAIAVATLAYVPLVSTTCSSTPGGVERCENGLGFELPGGGFTALVIAIVLALAVGVGLHLALLRSDPVRLERSGSRRTAP